MPSMLARRDFLALSGGAIAAISRLRPFSASPAYPSAHKFQSLLRIPSLLRPTQSDETTDYYEIEQRQASLEILPGRQTTIWGYQGMFPGPTIKTRQSRRTVIRHTNKLDVPTVVHLHGGATPSDSDGFPTDLILPGRQKTYSYPNDRAATLWYHDHAMDHTGLNIFMGLAGMYIVEGQEERQLPLPRGEYDVPLVFRTGCFLRTGRSYTGPIP